MTILDAIKTTGVNWNSLLKDDRLAAMEKCEQHPEFHGEGDVLTHTKMVVMRMAEIINKYPLDETRNLILMAAAALHDIGKPKTTVLIDDVWRAPNHSKIGANMIREALYIEGAERGFREAVCALTRFHQVPFFIFKNENKKAILRVAAVVEYQLLHRLALADNLGRVCKGQAETIEAIEMARMMVEEMGVWKDEPDYESENHRFQTLNGKPIEYVPWDNFSCKVTILSGLPAAGKSTYRAGYDGAVISLDELRKEMKVNPTDNQGAVVHRAFDIAKDFLRRKEDFLWDSTNISGHNREKLVKLCLDYGAHLTGINVETPWNDLLARNKTRENKVPEKVIFSLVRKWEPIAPWEVHKVLNCRS